MVCVREGSGRWVHFFFSSRTNVLVQETKMFVQEMESRREASVPAFGTDFVLRPSRPSLSSAHPGHPGDLALTQQWPLTLHRPVSNAQSGPGPVQLSTHGGHDFPTDASQSQVCHGEGPKRPGPVRAVSAYTTGQQDDSPWPRRTGWVDRDTVAVV